MLGEEDNLSDVLSIVSERAIERLHDGVRFLPDSNDAEQVFGFERVECGENVSPTLFPPEHHLFACCRAGEFEFAVAEAVRLFAVSGEKVSEARVRVAGNMLDEDSDGIRFRINRSEKIFVFELCDGGFGHAFMPAQLAANFFEVVGGEVGHRVLLQRSEVRLQK